MKTIGSSAVSRDGYMDDTSNERLVLSNREDWAEVYQLRAECDAIMVGAETIRRDNPALVLRDEQLRSERIVRGVPADIVKVTVTGSGHLDPALRFFTEGAATRKIVIAGGGADEQALSRLADIAEIVRLDDITAAGIVSALESRGISTLMLEGGSRTMKMFLDEEMVDELRLAVSPKIVGDEGAPRFPYYGTKKLEHLFGERRERTLGDMAIYEYSRPIRCVTHDERLRVLRAIELSRRCAPDATSYRVGCVIVATNGSVYEGHTHESGNRDHAEEEALKKAIRAGADLHGATAYVSMEPCSERKSKPKSCSELLVEYGVGRVIYASGEPEHFVKCDGHRRLESAGIEVIALPEYASLVRTINGHIK